MASPVRGGIGRPAVLLVALLCQRLLPASAAEPIAAGLHDLVILDPGAHERGLPAVEITDVKGGKRIDIPPKVHVHRYYYSGDKEIQGPIINGGPTVVVANHPKTGERMYIDAVLPAGAPRIAYSKDSITYVYPKQRVEIKFQHFPLNPCNAVVKVHHGNGWGRKLRKAHQHVKEHVKEGLANSPVAQSVKETSCETGDFLHGVKVALGDMTTRGGDGFRTLTNMVPGVTYLKSLAEQEPEKDYANLIRGEGITKARQATPFVPTNR